MYSTNVGILTINCITGHVVRELISLYTHNSMLSDTNTQSNVSTETAKQLRNFTQADLLAITNAANPCILSTQDFNVEVPTVKIDKIVDTTGAGDSFLGNINTYMLILPVNTNKFSLSGYPELTRNCMVSTTIVLPLQSSHYFLQRTASLMLILA